MTTTTRDRMLETTVRLLRKQGFNGTGLNQIIKESGTPKGSLYHHFPGGKDQLACEAIRAAGDQMISWMDEAFARTATPREAITAILLESAEELEQTDFECGCPIGAVALEVAATDSPVREACFRAFVMAQEMLMRNLVTAGYGPADAQGLAELMVTTYEGALLLSRAQRSTLPLTNLTKTLPRLLPH